jgi:hypothetical protein
MEHLLTEIVEKLQKAHGDKLVSVVLYGSAVAPGGRDALSDFNILCVLKQVTPDELHEAEPVFRWWREMKNPSPLLLSSDEVRNSTDSFPIEFEDMRAQHQVLFGEDVISGLTIGASFYRAQVEHELRAKLIRLRQKAGGILSDRELLLQLMAGSISTFCVLFRHALRIAGDRPVFDKREIVKAARERFGIDAAPFDTILDLREEKTKPKSVANPAELLRSYLHEIVTVVKAVDRMAH